MGASNVVVVGGSAGSHPALTRLVSGLPADLPAAVLVVIHVGAQSFSILPRLLSREGRLPAHHATDGRALRNGEILVAPAGFHLLVEGGTVRLGTAPRVNRARPAVDVLFESAAHTYGSRVTAVVLSGLLDDGAVGAALVSIAGGSVLVQSPFDAPYNSMPRAALASAPNAMAVTAGRLSAAVVRAVCKADAEPSRAVAADQRARAVVKMADSSAAL